MVLGVLVEMVEEGLKLLMRERECCGGRESFADSDSGNSEGGDGDGRGEGCKEGEVQESGGIQENYVGESRGDDGTMCALNVTRREYGEGGGLEIFCGGSGAGGEGEIEHIEQQSYHDNHLPAQAPGYSTSSRVLVSNSGAIQHTQWHL